VKKQLAGRWSIVAISIPIPPPAAIQSSATHRSTPSRTTRKHRETRDGTKVWAIAALLRKPLVRFGVRLNRFTSASFEQREDAAG
jgi:hypothetical protein